MFDPLSHDTTENWSCHFTRGKFLEVFYDMHSVGVSSQVLSLGLTMHNLVPTDGVLVGWRCICFRQQIVTVCCMLCASYLRSVVVSGLGRLPSTPTLTRIILKLSSIEMLSKADPLLLTSTLSA